jgi:hypothetical protein
MRCWIEIGNEKISGAVDIADSEITEICTFPLLIVIIKVMLLIVPTTIAKIKATKKPTLLVNDNYLLMVAP